MINYFSWLNEKKISPDIRLSEERISPRLLKDSLLLVVAVALVIIGLEGFVVPNGYLDGGVIGVALLVKKLTGIDLGLLVAIINVPFFVVSYRRLGKRIVVKTVVGVLLLALALVFIHIDPVTNNTLLATVFGGLFIGSGIGLALRAGAALDGTELVAVMASKRLALSIGDIILLINLLIFGFAAFIFTLETAMHSLLVYIIASFSIKFVSEGFDAFVAIHIISDKHETLRGVLTEKFSLATTRIEATGGYSPPKSKKNPFPSPQERPILLCLVTKLEIMRVRRIVQDIDKNAFVYTLPVKEAFGGALPKRNAH